ncbi:DNA polymerase III subunit gamma/tau, partial [Amnimonas aquatica]
MGYQVLARKYRPKRFQELVGQDVVARALTHALEQDRLHHAYLFTGTRGVGKTTIARILSRCLNCETGVSANPCGVCSTCREIDEGRFVDLIEVDAASRTKVEDTRELLENVQYAPTRGRYKVYLIDEVHMLSGHSFNALLKTLEEPPPHVKFLLATTDPQKLPITILSRCLQFALKPMTPERVVGHLQQVLQQEGIAAEEGALWLLARGAQGSMRDALSLTDQAIAFGHGSLREDEVRALLGSIDRDLVFRVLDAIHAGDAGVLLRVVAGMAEQSIDFAGALAEMITVLHRLAVAQAVPEAIDNAEGDRDRLLALASAITAEDLQLYYQMALHGRRDLPLAVDPRAGFEMTVLRMLAFRPQVPGARSGGGSPAAGARGAGGAAVTGGEGGVSAAPAPAAAAPVPVAAPAAERVSPVPASAVPARDVTAPVTEPRPMAQ